MNPIKYKCSFEAGKFYKEIINEYLQKKGIEDFSKYSFYIKKDELVFDKWDYPGVEKMNEKLLGAEHIEIPKNYIDLGIRLVSITILDKLKFPTNYFNVDGKEIPPNYKDPFDRQVQYIISSGYKPIGDSKFFSTGNTVFLISGMIAIRRELTDGKEVKGEFHINIIYRPHLFLPSTAPSIKTVSYTIPDNLINF